MPSALRHAELALNARKPLRDLVTRLRQRQLPQGAVTRAWTPIVTSGSAARRRMSSRVITHSAQRPLGSNPVAWQSSVTRARHLCAAMVAALAGSVGYFEGLPGAHALMRRYDCAAV